MFFVVKVSSPDGPSRGVVFIDETFDAPDWQTALRAAAEVVKVDPAFIEPDSACDLVYEAPCDACVAGACVMPHPWVGGR